MVTSLTAPFAAADGRFCFVATLTAAGMTELEQAALPPSIRLLTPSLLPFQVFLRGLSGHLGGSRNVQQRSLLGPMEMLHVPAAAAVWRPQTETRLEPEAAGVLCQRQRTGVCESVCAPEHLEPGAVSDKRELRTRLGSWFVILTLFRQEIPMIYPAVPAEQRRPIRVLSLFDGIATGKAAGVCVCV